MTANRTVAPAVTQAYDLVMWTLPHVRKFPKDYKFWLGTRMADAAVDLLERLVDASYTANRVDLLRDANLRIERLRHLFRLARDLGSLEPRQHEFAAVHLDDLGRQVGGWLKASRPAAPARPDAP
jgi:hypothetical protein